MVKPMLAVAARRQHLIAIETKEGFLVTRAFRTEIVPYFCDRFSVDSSNVRTPIAGGAGWDFSIPKDSTQTEILRITKGRGNTLWQVFWGWHQPNLRIFWEYPEGTGRRGNLENDIGGHTHSSSVESTFGWLLEGRESPAGNPTEKGHFWLIPEVSVGVGGFNPAGEKSVLPACTFYINKVKHIPLDPRKSEDMKVIQRVLGGPASPDIHTWQPGVEAIEYGQFTQQWKVPPVKWDGAKATIARTVAAEVD